MELSLETLLSAAQDAASTGRLGHRRGASAPAFIHEDGAPCAISAAFWPALLQRIVDAGDIRLNWLELMRAGHFGFGSGIVMAETLASLQLGYDRCFDADPAVRARRTAQFVAYLVSFDPEHPPQEWPSEVAEHPLWDD